MTLSEDLLGVLLLSTVAQGNNVDLANNTTVLLFLFFLLAEESEEHKEEERRRRERERERNENFGAFRDGCGCMRFN